MQIKNSLLGAGALALALTFTSCNNDDEKSSQLSKQDAKAKLATFNSDASQDLQDLADADGVKAMQDFFDLTAIDEPLDGRLASDKKRLRAFLHDKGLEFKSVFVPAGTIKGRTEAEEPFDFDGNKGIYSWNEEIQQFEYQDGSTNIEILFPTEGAETNNAKLQITAYDEQLVEDPEFGDVYYQPTLIKANLFVSEVKKASLDLSIDFDDLGFPTSAEIELMVSPFTASLSFDVSGSTSSTLSFSMLHNTETLVATSVTVKYADSSKSEESLTSIEGFAQIKNVKLQGSIDAQGGNGESVDFNDFVKLALYADNVKVGDIVFETENASEVAYVKYADGSKEKLEEVLQPVVDELDALSDSLNNNG